MPDTLLKKRLRAYDDDGTLYTDTCKRMYSGLSNAAVEPMPPPPELSQAAIQLLKQATSPVIDALRPEVAPPTADMKYVQQHKQSMKEMDWKMCFEAGKQEGFFSSYSSSASLKTAFYKKKANKA
ncbi:hypothetical protein RMATCC62417_15667 [Rhizopus microsporus]|nr:hypothetical protein RMATCC62417_15667 [Rhizopus microsporus]